MHGERLDDINYLHTHNISPETVSSELAKIFSEMIFFHGFVVREYFVAIEQQIPKFCT